MRNVLGIVVIVAGVILGAYVGVWIMLVGGIAGLIDVVVNAVALK